MKIKTILIIALISFICSCAKTPSKTVHPNGIRNQRAINLESSLKERKQKINTLHGFAKVFIDDNVEILETEAAIVIERPNQFRIEAMDSLADTWAIAGLNGSKFWLNLPQKNKLYQKKAKKKYLKKYLAADINFTDLISIISGIIPSSSSLKLAELNYKTRHYRAYFEPLHIYYDKKKQLPLKLVKYSFLEDAAQEENSVIQYEVYFSQWELINDLYFPMKIILISPKLGSQVIIKYQVIELNKKVDNKIFNPL